MLRAALMKINGDAAQKLIEINEIPRKIRAYGSFLRRLRPSLDSRDRPVLCEIISYRMICGPDAVAPLERGERWIAEHGSPFSARVSPD
jgi:hypothetical protein